MNLVQVEQLQLLCMSRMWSGSLSESNRKLDLDIFTYLPRAPEVNDMSLSLYSQKGTSMARVSISLS